MVVQWPFISQFWIESVYNCIWIVLESSTSFSPCSNAILKNLLYSILKIYNVCGGRIVLEGFNSCGGCSRSSTLRLIEVKVLHKMFALYWRCLKISSFSKPGLLVLELWRHSKQWVCAKYTLILLEMFLPEIFSSFFWDQKCLYIKENVCKNFFHLHKKIYLFKIHLVKQIR